MEQRADQAVGQGREGHQGSQHDPGQGAQQQAAAGPAQAGQQVDRQLAVAQQLQQGAGDGGERHEGVGPGGVLAGQVFPAADQQQGQQQAAKLGQ